MDLAHLRSEFDKTFAGASGGVFFAARAPGRVNLIGEHTDYNEGLVCPMAIDRATTILAAPRADAVVRLHSLGLHETVEFSVASVVAKEGPAWSLYARGAAEAMRHHVAISRGFDAVMDSDVPLGGGLSSSAAFELATALTLLAVNGQSLPAETLALACQWAEHHYPGMPCGIMDQFVCAMGQQGHALLLDCRDRSTRQVPLDDPEQRVVVSNSNVHHELVSGEYAARRRQCEEAVTYLQEKFPAVMSLRDATMGQLEASRGNMDAVVFRRARHVITEIQRTADFAGALQTREYARCGALMGASHTSLRDDYEVSCPELDALVEIARSVTGVLGARMTGGGFGGCIVALCRSGAVEALTRAIAAEYPRRTGGKTATTFSTVPSAGASVARV